MSKTIAYMKLVHIEDSLNTCFIWQTPCWIRCSIPIKGL